MRYKNFTAMIIGIAMWDTTPALEGGGGNCPLWGGSGLLKTLPVYQQASRQNVSKGLNIHIYILNNLMFIAL
jgi:hypothetical protein